MPMHHGQGQKRRLVNTLENSPHPRGWDEHEIILYLGKYAGATTGLVPAFNKNHLVEFEMIKSNDRLITLGPLRCLLQFYPSRTDRFLEAQAVATIRHADGYGVFHLLDDSEVAELRINNIAEQVALSHW